MQAQRRDDGTRLIPGVAKVSLACLLTCGIPPWATSVIAQDTAKIRISLTIPEKIQAQVYASEQTPRTRDVCILSGDSVAYSVARLIVHNDSWRLSPLHPAVSKSNTGVCAASVMFSIEGDSSNTVTLVFSPE